MPDPRHILVVHQGSELYGSDRMVLQLLYVLNGSSDRAVTLHLPCPGPLADKARALVAFLRIAPISILRLYSLKTLRWLNLVAFCRAMRFAWAQLRQHDTVIINSIVILSYLLLLPFYKGRKFVYVHEINTGLIKWVFNILLSLTGAQLICNSHATARNYPLVKAHRKHVVYNSLDFDDAMSEPDTGSGLRLLLIGRISPRKGHHVLIKALARLDRSARDTVQLRIVGDSFGGQTAYSQSLYNLIKSHDLSGQIAFHDFAVDPSDHYRWANCVIVPSVKPESFGLVAWEAMMHGRAVIAAATGALSELVIPGETGSVFAPGNDVELAKALKFYRTNPHLLKQHGLAGRVKASRDFSPAVYRTHIERIVHG